MLHKKVIKEYYLPSGSICANSALLIRLMEYVKETPSITDVEIHKVVETMARWNEKYPVLNMDAYQSILTGASPARE